MGGTLVEAYPLTVRAYIATAIFAGLAGNYELYPKTSRFILAKASVEAADALIAELNKP
jgi:hypothetical protein